MSARRLALSAAAIASVSVLGGCGDTAQPPAFLRVADGVPEQGHGLIKSYGCGACHEVEGVRGARGTVGPPLVGFAGRTLIAGILPNTPRNLVPWLMDPVALDPQTAMPSMGLTEADARHVAAYLYTLGAAESRLSAAGPAIDLVGQEPQVADPSRNPSGKSLPANTPPRVRFEAWKARQAE